MGHGNAAIPVCCTTLRAVEEEAYTSGVLLHDPPLTFHEHMTKEALPLAVIFPEVLRWLGGRTDAVLFGAQAVNAWVECDGSGRRGRSLTFRPEI